MTIFFEYGDETPPSPFLIVSIQSLETGLQIGELPGRVDTGADRTVVPKFLIDQIGCSIFDYSLFADFTGQEFELPLFRIVLTIQGLNSIGIVVASIDDRDELLLGRDVLNQYRILLDGPQRRLEIQ